MMPPTPYSKMRANRITQEAATELERLRVMRRDRVRKRIDALEREQDEAMRAKHGPAYDADTEGEEGMKALRAQRQQMQVVLLTRRQRVGLWLSAVLNRLTRGCH